MAPPVDQAARHIAALAELVRVQPEKLQKVLGLPGVRQAWAQHDRGTRTAARARAAQVAAREHPDVNASHIDTAFAALETIG